MTYNRAPTPTVAEAIRPAAAIHGRIGWGPRAGAGTAAGGVVHIWTALTVHVYGDGLRHGGDYTARRVSSWRRRSRGPDSCRRGGHGSGTPSQTADTAPAVTASCYVIGAITGKAVGTTATADAAWPVLYESGSITW